MKLWDIVKTVGAGIIKEVVPGGGLLISAVNEFLPEDKKLPANATGKDINNTIQNLPPDVQAKLMEKEFDVELTEIKESHSTVRAMLESDAKNPQTTRPYIAKHSFHTVAFVSVLSVFIWAYGITTENEKIVTTIMEGWPFVLSVIGPLVSLLWAYFGILKKEHSDKLKAANGDTTPSGLSGIITSILKR